MLSRDHLPRIQESILLTGGAGSGKSYLAMKIHADSLRKDYQFLQVNIASLNNNLFESELFGHKKGSFTGAVSDRRGFCEKVGRGTLFLDEIGELSLEGQKKLLNLIEEKIFFSVGSETVKKFQGVFLFATNKDLFLEVKKGSFREDLYHRLRGFSYRLESLSERRDKLMLIQKEFLKAKFKYHKENLKMSGETFEFLRSYSFPGNYRELKQILDYATFLACDEVDLRHLPIWVREESENLVKLGDSYYSALEKFERSFLVNKLQKFQGRINYTSQMIEISKVTLISKIKKYDINIQSYKVSKMTM